MDTLNSQDLENFIRTDITIGHGLRVKLLKAVDDDEAGSILRALIEGTNEKFIDDSARTELLRLWNLTFDDTTFRLENVPVPTLAWIARSHN